MMPSSPAQGITSSMPLMPSTHTCCSRTAPQVANRAQLRAEHDTLLLLMSEAEVLQQDLQQWRTCVDRCGELRGQIAELQWQAWDLEQLEQQAQKLQEQVQGQEQRMAQLQQQEQRLQELQSELVHMSRLTAMGEMASALAHELNQPLSAMANYLKGSSRLLAAEPVPRERLLEAIEKAGDQALRAGEIIRRLRDFVARGEAERRVESLPKLIEEASALALVGAKEHGVRVQFKEQLKNEFKSTNSWCRTGKAVSDTGFQAEESDSERNQQPNQ